MSKCKKIFAIILAVIMVTLTAVPVFADSKATVIINPYENVDWSAYNRYKADLHSHTNASDGEMTLKESVEKHYELGYDILAVSDHGTTSYSWTEENVVASIKLFSMLRRGKSAIELLKTEGEAENGTSYTVSTVNGDDYYAQAGGSDMLRVPFAIENNPTSFNNAHVNSFFVDYGNGILGGTSDYVTPISNIDKLGGVSVINHPGEYTSAREERFASDAYDRSNARYKYDIEKFESMLMNYDTCIGIDVNSKGDYRTRFDRQLWDIMLTDLVPCGRNVFAIASSDAHNLGIINSGFVTALMPENTSAALRNCLANGEFFACSRYIGNVEEVRAYADMLKGSDLGDAMAEYVAKTDAELANGKQSSQFEFCEDAAAPYISSITVTDNVISIDGENIECVRWISEGKQIGEGSEIAPFEAGAGSYVRAEIIGEGGIVYTQAFRLTAGDRSTYKGQFKDFGKVAGILDPVIKFLGSFESVYRAILKMMKVI